LAARDVTEGDVGRSASVVQPHSLTLSLDKGKFSV
jgi:hypothetical protein